MKRGRKQSGGGPAPKRGRKGAARGSSGKRRGAAELLESMREKLQGARFRWINEKLYKETGAEALEQFQQDTSLFDVYHQGYTTQVEKWPEDPLDRVIGLVRQLRLKKKRGVLCVADMGCGVARLAETLLGEAAARYRVHSYDLVACNKYVTACNIGSVPLADEAVDAVVFCLSLMGTDYVSFLVEGRRVLRDGGTMIIAETKSRIPSVGRFVRGVETLGFARREADESNKMFVLFQFVKTSAECAKQHAIEYAQKLTALKPCLYKRR